MMQEDKDIQSRRRAASTGLLATVTIGVPALAGCIAAIVTSVAGHTILGSAWNRIR